MDLFLVDQSWLNGRVVSASFYYKTAAGVGAAKVNQAVIYAEYRVLESPVSLRLPFSNTSYSVEANFGFRFKFDPMAFKKRLQQQNTQ